MNSEIQKVHGFEPLEEAQLVQQFQVEELEKRYEFAWIDRVVVGVSPSGYTCSM
ncbi:hypothetical protein [Flavobacterium sp.]|uniref:hypothetical protein n=1 Tax=Flavobacterium sp. TaxID=239 RepID=UPI00379D4A90